MSSATGQSSEAVTGMETETETGPEIEREIGHDEFDPIGTLVLVSIYFVIIGLLWLFVYFVEFLGRGPTVV
jgi:hypothetical protein